MSIKVIYCKMVDEKKRIIISTLFLFILFLGCDRSPSSETLPPEPMPAFNEDVLWISSVPLGAKVIIFQKEKSHPFSPNKEDVSVNEPCLLYLPGGDSEIDHKTGPFAHEIAGVTPLKIKVSPGAYGVIVQLDVSSENIQSGFMNAREKTEEGRTVTNMFTENRLEVYEYFAGKAVGFDNFGNPTSYLQDGNIEMWGFYHKGLLKEVAKSYEIEKEDGKPATLIALFQRCNEDPGKIYNMLPPEYQFNKRHTLMPEILEMWGISKAESAQYYQQLLHGGKVLRCDSSPNHLMLELKPVEITISDQSTTYTGGYTMSISGDYFKVK